MKRYDEHGCRLTDCCGCYSTYMDAGDGSEMLCCKMCHWEVGLGEGDGSERKTDIVEDMILDDTVNGDY